MTASRIAVFERSIEKTNVILRDIRAGLGSETLDEAYRALRATLHALRDRLGVEEASQLAAQLPLVLKGVYYDGWRPAATPHPIRSAREFLHEVAGHLGRPAGDMEAIVRTVFATLDRYVSEGEVLQVKGSLPKDIRSLWP